MNFKEMEYILAVEQEKNLTKAARKIGISQPAMSKCLRNIETELGVSLFEKNSGWYYSGKKQWTYPRSIAGVQKELS